jgi:hypothetical protein
MTLIHDMLQRFSSTELDLPSENEGSSEYTEETKGSQAVTDVPWSLRPRPLHHLGVKRSELLFEDSDTEEPNVCQ